MYKNYWSNGCDFLKNHHFLLELFSCTKHIERYRFPHIPEFAWISHTLPLNLPCCINDNCDKLPTDSKNSIVYLIDVDGEDELDPLYIAGITFASLLVFLLLVVFILSILMVYRKKSKYYDL